MLDNEDLRLWVATGHGQHGACRLFLRLGAKTVTVEPTAQPGYQVRDATSLGDGVLVGHVVGGHLRDGRQDTHSALGDAAPEQSHESLGDRYAVIRVFG